MIKPKIFLIIVIILVILVIAGAIILTIKKAPPGEEAAIAEEVYGFSAEIKEIRDKTLILEGWIPLVDMEKEPIKATVRGIVTDETKIAKLKFPEVPEGGEEPVYPEETEMSFEELKIGDRIDISTIENISELGKLGTCTIFTLRIVNF